MAKLDTDFIKRATKVTSFNLTSSDFTSVKHKLEIQTLYRDHMFGSFDPSMALDKLDTTNYNKLVDLLRKDDKEQYYKLHNLSLKGVGPAEAVLYLLTKNAHLGGGSSAGVDLVNGSAKYEVKAVSWKSKSKRDYVSNFKLGGNIPGMTQLEADIQLKCYQLKITSSKGAPEISGSKFDQLKEMDPAAYQEFRERYQTLAYEHYFKGHDVIFILNDPIDRQFGHIVALKKVQKQDIEMERYTSRSIKPLVKV